MNIVNPLTGKQPENVRLISAGYHTSPQNYITVDEHRNGSIHSQVFSDKYFSAFVHELQFDQQTRLDIYDKHQFQSFVVPVTGKVVWEQTGSMDLPIRENHLCFMPASNNQTPAKVVVPKGISRLWIVILRPHYVSLVRENLLHCYRQPRLLHPYELQRLQDIRRPNPTVPSMLRQRVTLLNLSFNVIDDLVTRKYHPVSTAFVEAERIVQAKEYIDANLEKPLAAIKIASAICLTVPQLNRGFRIVYGISPIDYLIDKRLHVAKQLLRDTDTPVKEIAWEVGYESVAGFTRVFSARVGMDPTTYRRSCKPDFSNLDSSFPIG